MVRQVADLQRKLNLFFFFFAGKILEVSEGHVGWKLEEFVLGEGLWMKRTSGVSAKDMQGSFVSFPFFFPFFFCAPDI